MIKKGLGPFVLWLSWTNEAIAQEESIRFNMPYGVTSASQQIHDLHMLVLWVCVVIGVGVFAVMGWSLFKHRKSRGVVAAQFSGNTKLEIVWTLIPALILIAIAIPATRVLLEVNAQPDPDVTVDVRGVQWKWHYSYAGQGIAFDSNMTEESRHASRKGADQSPNSVPNYLRDVDHPLVLPVGKNIRLRITADDVIHSWWVPELGFKRDAIPGFINEVNFVIDKTGTYRGQCAELCGAGHAFMPIVVKVVNQAEFDAWLAQKQQARAKEEQVAQALWSRGLAMEQGRSLFAANCAACHQIDGKGIPGTFPPLDGSPVVNGPLAGHLKIVLHGSPRNPVMRAFGKELDDHQIAALVTYERNAWSNHTGDLVTPEQVKIAR